MDHRCTRIWTLAIVASVVFCGCRPMQPYFLHEDGDLSHYVDVATDIEFADVDTETLPDAAEAHAPLEINSTKIKEFWDLTLEEVVHISLQNSKVLRTVSQVRQYRQVGQSVASPPENLGLNVEFTPTIYDPAIVQTGPNGQEAALAAFDTQFTTNLFWDRTDRPQNVSVGTGAAIFARILERDLMNFQSQLQKRSANGTQWSVRNLTTYDSSNRPLRVLTSEWLTSFEAEARQPILRGRGTQINRIPVVLARIQTDISLAEFGAGVRNHLSDVERGYWELYFYYRNLKAAKVGRDSALLTWKRIHSLYQSDVQGGEAENEAQAREQYFFFRGRVEEAKRDLLKAERQLRFLMGVAPTDGRVIRPIDEPTLAKVEFDWAQILSEAVTRSEPIRRQKWRVKEAELQLVAARNNLLPRFDAVAIYRWLGLGDDLLQLANRRGLDFPNPGSLAWDNLAQGDFQEWRLGFEFEMPIGFRAELNAVRNRQLEVARAKARLEDLELETSHGLTDAIQNLDSSYVLTQTAFLQRAAAEKQVEALRAKLDAGTVTLDLLLDAQRRAADAETAFYRSLVQYNFALVEVHYRKGSLPDYLGVILAEGPWPAKAYWDAMIRARQRDASYYFDYGYTRPSVVSQGPVTPIASGQPSPQSAEELPAGPAIEGESDDELLPQPEGTPHDSSAVEPRSALRLKPADTPRPQLELNKPYGAGEKPSGNDSNDPKFHWGSLGLGDQSVQQAVFETD